MADYTYTQSYAFGASNTGEAFTVTNQAAEVVATGTVAAGGTGSLEITVPDDSTSILTFTRDGDSVRLATVVFDPREIPALNGGFTGDDRATLGAVQVQANKFDAAHIVMTSPITADGGRITLTQGADYTAASGWPVRFNLTGAAAVNAYSAGIDELRLIACNGALQVVGDVSGITGGFQASFDIGKAVTAALDEGASEYFIEATLAGGIETPTLSKGKLHVELGGVQVTE